MPVEAVVQSEFAAKAGLPGSANEAGWDAISAVRNRLEAAAPGYGVGARALNAALFIVHHCSHFAGSSPSMASLDAFRTSAKARLWKRELVSLW